MRSIKLRAYVKDIKKKLNCMTPLEFRDYIKNCHEKSANS